MPGEAVTLDEIRAAAARIRPLARRTPVLSSRHFDEAAGATCFFKCENFQRSGSFKMRGAANFVLSMSAEERRRGVVAFSSGNHAQAVAIAAAHVGAPATIVMPSDAPKSKLASTRAYHPRIILYDRLREDREEIGRRVAEETNAMTLPPFDHPWTIAGQGTATLELVEEVAALDTIVVCLGGGGLLAGALVAAKTLNPAVRVFGVEPEAGNDWALSLAAGERVEIPPPVTLADGLRTPKPGAVTFPLVQRLVDGVVLVSEEELKATMRFLLSRMKILAEPSGAAAAAAVLHHKIPDQSGRIGIFISGGNVDMDVLASICAEA